jgi:hypothetical protein
MTTIPVHQLGDLVVPAVGVGAMVLSPGMYGDIDDHRALFLADLSIAPTLAQITDG